MPEDVSRPVWPIPRSMFPWGNVYFDGNDLETRITFYRQALFAWKRSGGPRPDADDELLYYFGATDAHDNRAALPFSAVIEQGPEAVAEYSRAYRERWPENVALYGETDSGREFHWGATVGKGLRAGYGFASRPGRTYFTLRPDLRPPSTKQEALF